MTKQEFNRLRVGSHFDDGVHVDCRVEKKNKNELRYTYWSASQKDYIVNIIKFSDCQDEPNVQPTQKRKVKLTDKDIKGKLIEETYKFISEFDPEHFSYTDLDCDGNCQPDMKDFAETIKSFMETIKLN